MLKRAAHLVARSAWAARLLARHPILLDELTRNAASFPRTDWDAEAKMLRGECRELAPDPERLLDHLRHYKQRQMLRLTIADIEEEIAVMALSDELSSLADTILEITVEEAAHASGWMRVLRTSSSWATESWAARNSATAPTSTSSFSTTKLRHRPRSSSHDSRNA